MSTVIRPRTDVCLIAAIAAIAVLTCRERALARAVPAPAAPVALHVTARSETSLSLRWEDRSRSEAYYRVRVSGRARRLAANREALTVTGLRPGVAYRLTVQACSRADRCSKAVVDTATTEPAPSAPTTPPTTTVDVVGRVTVTTGDCMPTVGGKGNRANACLTSPAAGARVLLYAPVLTVGADLPGVLYHGPQPPSAQTMTDASGRFRLLAEPGSYSFLVDTGAGPECGRSDADWSACPHTLLAPTQTVDLNLDHADW